jgi:NADH:ubiquinone oxidoreductase subunit K
VLDLKLSWLSKKTFLFWIKQNIQQFFMIISLLSIWGIVLNKKNIFIMLMLIELMLLVMNLNLFVFSIYLDDMMG